MKTITARISLLSPEEGGRETPISTERDFNCPMYFPEISLLQGIAYDSRILMSRLSRDILPGDKDCEVQIAFLSPGAVLPHIGPRTTFELWERRVIGRGTVVKLN